MVESSPRGELSYQSIFKLEMLKWVKWKRTDMECYRMNCHKELLGS